MATPYNGWPSWNAWNVALWIGNEEPLYRLAMEAIKKGQDLAGDKQDKSSIANYALGYFFRWAVCKGDRTPDGARYTARSVKLALLALME